MSELLLNAAFKNISLISRRGEQVTKRDRKTWRRDQQDRKKDGKKDRQQVFERSGVLFVKIDLAAKPVAKNIMLFEYRFRVRAS